MRFALAVFMALGISTWAAADESAKTLRYLRPAGSEFRLETEITLRRSGESVSIASVTHRGKRKLSLTSRFSAGGRLQSANVSIVSDNGRQSAQVHADGAKATVKRHDGRVDGLDCPAGIIVTSAPDWTDAFMLVRRYDRKQGGVQKFEGLWIHPTLRPLRLTLTVRHEGTDSVTKKGEPQKLERFSITLRNGSRYVAWRNGQMDLVRLVANGQPQPAVVLNGWEGVALP